MTFEELKNRLTPFLNQNNIFGLSPQTLVDSSFANIVTLLNDFPSQSLTIEVDSSNPDEVFQQSPRGALLVEGRIKFQTTTAGSFIGISTLSLIHI